MDPAKEAQMNGMLFHLASQLEGGAIEVFFCSSTLLQSYTNVYFKLKFYYFKHL